MLSQATRWPEDSLPLHPHRPQSSDPGPSVLRAMDSGFIVVDDSPPRAAASPMLPGPDWALQPYTFRTRITVPINDAVSNDFEHRIGKAVAKIVRWDVPEGTIVPCLR